MTIILVVCAAYIIWCLYKTSRYLREHPNDLRWPDTPTGKDRDMADKQSCKQQYKLIAMKRKGILKQVLTIVLTMAALVTGQTAKAIDLTADGSSVTTSETWTDCMVNVTGNGTITFTERITISGTVTLNLGADATLTAQKGLLVTEGNSLVIDGSGSLIINNCDNNNAGIGSNLYGACGSITINSGNVTVTGGNDAAGIGSGAFGSGGTITIRGGVVNATGGSTGGTGIGGGNFSPCGDITITGGQVTATGGYMTTYGIGAGNSGSTSGSLTLGWSDESDFISAVGGLNRIYSISFVEGKSLYIDRDFVTATTSNVRRNYDITLKPLVDSKRLNVASANGLAEQYAYTGEAFNIGCIIKDVDGTLLTEGTHYTATTTPTPVRAIGDYTLDITALGGNPGGYTGASQFAFKVSDLIGDDNGQKYICMPLRNGNLFVSQPKTFGMVWPTGLSSLKIYADGGKGAKFKKLTNANLILTAPEDYVIQLTGNISVAQSGEVLTVYSGYGVEGTQLYRFSANTKDTYDIGTVSGIGRTITIRLVTGSANFGDGLDLTASLKSMKDLEVSNISIPEYFSYQDGAPVDITFTAMDGSGKIMVEGTDYVKTVKKVGTVTALDNVTELGKYELTILPAAGSNYINSKSASFYVCEGVLMTSATTLMENNTYSVVEDMTVNRRIDVSGDVKLVIWEGKELTAQKGIEVNGNNKLTIEGEGTLTATSSDYNATIGNSFEHNGGTIIINNGIINASNTGSYDNCYYPAIGGYSGFCDVTINGGQVTASSIGGYLSGSTGTLTLGWTSADDFVSSGNYYGVPEIKFADGKLFRLDGTTTVADMTNMGGKKIVPMTDAQTKDLAYATVSGLNRYYGFTDGKNVHLDYSVTDAFGRQLKKGVDFDEAIISGYSNSVVEAPYGIGNYTLQITPHQGSIYTGSCERVLSVRQKVPVQNNLTALTNDVYVVTSDQTVTERMVVTGEADLYIAEGKTLTAKKGIEVSIGNTLVIEGGGTLVIDDCADNKSGIGAEQVGTIIINGGTLNVTGGEDAADIGCDGVNTSMGGTIIINGGIINATGGGSILSGSTGLGGGPLSQSIGNVIINGGQVTAEGIGCYNTSGKCNGTLTLGWTNADDFINFSKISNQLTFKFIDGKNFYIEGTTTDVTSENIKTVAIVNRKLVPKPDPHNLLFATLNDIPRLNKYTGELLNYTIRNCEGTTLVKDQDYTVTMTCKTVNTVQVTEIRQTGAYTLTIDGIGDYEGSKAFNVFVRQGGRLTQASQNNVSVFRDDIYIISAGEHVITDLGKRLSVEGEVIFILEDGCNFYPKYGLDMGEGSKLTIEASGTGTGILYTCGYQDSNNPGICIGDMGTLVIKGGNIEVVGDGSASGISGQGGTVIFDITNLNGSIKTTYGNNLASVSVADGTMLTDGANYYTNESTKGNFTSLTIDDVLQPCYLLGETTGISNAAATEMVGKPAIFSRTFNAGKASTICLPFDLTSVTGGKVYAFQDVTYNSTDGWVVTMVDASPGPGNEVKSTVANTPYLFLPESDGEVTFRGTASASVAAGATVSGDWTFHGTYSRKDYGDEGFSGTVFGFAGTSGKATDGVTDVEAGQFVKAASGAYILPFRAYLTYAGGNSALKAPGRGIAATPAIPDRIKVRLLNRDGGTTATGTIDLNTGEITRDRWYYLNGQPVEGAPTAPGMYLNADGKKVMITE